jgi:hypothetical protein
MNETDYEGIDFLQHIKLVPILKAIADDTLFTDYFVWLDAGISLEYIIITEFLIICEFRGRCSYFGF